MVTYLDQNLSIIQHRWPEVAQALAAAPELHAELVQDGPQATLRIDGIYLASRYDRRAEAAQQASLIPHESVEAWVYGFGLGDLPRELLRRPQLQRLQVVLFNPAESCQSIDYFDHRDWLVDQRVEILTGADQARVRFPFAAIPSSLRLADAASARLRDLVELELATPFIRKRHAADNPELQARLRENEPYVVIDRDVANLFGRYQGATVLVAGAGPTLAEHFMGLHDRQAPLVAVDAALKPLIAAGIVPDAVVTIDGHAETINRFFRESDLGGCRETPLVYFPTVHRGVYEIWPGPRHVAYSSAPLFHDLRRRHPRSELFSAGSVIHPAVDLAVRMGAARVVLLGTDFAYPGGRSHVAGCAAERELPGSDHDPWVAGWRGQRLTTSANLRGYLRDLEIYIERQQAVQFYCASSNGARVHGADLWEGIHGFQ